MRRSLWLTWFYVGTVAFLRGPAAAQIYEPVTARQLLQNPTRYLGYRIELTNAYCASIESGKYECTTRACLQLRRIIAQASCTAARKFVASLS